MSFLSCFSRILIVAATTASLASCNYVAAVIEDDFPIEKVDDAYAARDTCLKWTVVMTDDGTTDAAEMGARVARSCGAEITALVMATDPHGDPTVAGKIQADSTFRATGYVIRIRQAAGDVAAGRSYPQKR
jgi:hypothetical protein